MEILIVISMLVYLVFVLNYLVRMERFGRFMRAEVDRVYNLRINGNREVQYPKIGASYDNFKWYDVFNYKFDSLVVYEDDDTR